MYLFRSTKLQLLTDQSFNSVRYQVSSAAPLNYVTESQKLIELIKQYNID